MFGDELARPSVPPSLTTTCPSSTFIFFPSGVRSQMSPPLGAHGTAGGPDTLQLPPIVGSPAVAAHVIVTGKGRSTTVALHEVVELQGAEPAVL